MKKKLLATAAIVGTLMLGGATAAASEKENALVNQEVFSEADESAEIIYAEDVVLPNGEQLPSITFKEENGINKYSSDNGKTWVDEAPGGLQIETASEGTQIELAE
jgi:hypothetical protein